MAQMVVVHSISHRDVDNILSIFGYEDGSPMQIALQALLSEDLCFYRRVQEVGSWGCAISGEQRYFICSALVALRDGSITPGSNFVDLWDGLNISISSKIVPVPEPTVDYVKFQFNE
ncbi:unnamed protein product [Dovyalis caffra]|uniref:Uncharacterized protein n=1 Tax=Dovyalis caffra TaxID=77055 RepID=A0AAV1QYL5_9ROSI|nr:unnamed protein product [Dovyalis caffra]